MRSRRLPWGGPGGGGAEPNTCGLLGSYVNGEEAEEIEEPDSDSRGLVRECWPSRELGE